MGLAYRACFQTGTARKTELKDIAIAVREWASKKCGAEIPEFAQELDRHFGQKGEIHVRSAFMDRNGAPCFAFEMTHPDFTTAGLDWRVTLAFAKNGGDLFNTEIALYNRWADSAREGNYLSPSSPNITGIIIQKFGGRCSFDLGTGPVPLPYESTRVKNFADLIYNPERKLPIVLISALNASDRPVLPAEEITKIAWRLAGTARVYVAKDRFSSFKLDEYVGKSMGCWNGAARLYWPIPAKGERPFHPYWLADDLSRIKRTFVLGLMSRIASLTAGLKCPVSFPELMDHHSKAKQDQLLMKTELQKVLVEHAGLRELFDLSLDENATLGKQVASLTEANRDLENRLRQAEGRIEQLTLALEERKVVPGEPPREQRALVFRNVREAMEQIQHSYSENTIVITKKAMEGAKKSMFEDPRAVYDALEWLATAYLRMGKADVPALRASCHDRCGMLYHASQGASVEHHPEDYHVTFGGRTYDLREHLSKGNTKDGRRTIRIGFDYDSAGRRVIVGYISQHQTTAAT